MMRSVIMQSAPGISPPVLLPAEASAVGFTIWAVLSGEHAAFAIETTGDPLLDKASVAVAKWSAFSAAGEPRRYDVRAVPCGPDQPPVFTALRYYPDAVAAARVRVDSLAPGAFLHVRFAAGRAFGLEASAA